MTISGSKLPPNDVLESELDSAELPEKRIQRWMVLDWNLFLAPDRVWVPEAYWVLPNSQKMYLVLELSLCLGPMFVPHTVLLERPYLWIEPHCARALPLSNRYQNVSLQNFDFFT